MNSTTAPANHPMLIVECPLCDGPAPFDTAAGELTCDACGVAVDIAPEPCLVLAAA